MMRISFPFRGQGKKSLMQPKFYLIRNSLNIKIMKRLFYILFFMSTTIMANADNNPFFSAYNTPYQTPPFHLIKTEHYEPAFEEAIKQHEKEIIRIIENPKEPTFENTVEALERSGKLLSKVSDVFFNLLSAESNEKMEDISQRISPKLSEHSNNIYLNEKLFSRIQDVYLKIGDLDLTIEEERLLDETYDAFVNKGINLPADKKEEYRKLTSELSQLTLQFGQNLLKETNAYLFHTNHESDLNGLPQSALDAAALKAKQKKLGGWAFDLTAPSYVPFMKYADNRDLRKKMYMAYNSRCISNNETDNRDIVKKIVNLRMEIAQLMGYDNYAKYILRRRMAGSEDKVYNLQNQLLEAYKPVAMKEYEDIEKYAYESENTVNEIKPWDWAYYSEKLKNSRYDINDEMLKPYFNLENVKRGVFRLANELYGLIFTKNSKIPVYHPEVEAYEVFDAKGQFLAVLFTDFHPREGKRAGAWMTSYKGQYKINEEDSRPHISLVMNFTRPTETAPALLTFDEVTTFLHEFGHGLHGILADVTYESLSGTNVYWDFVELPSQIMENWGNEKAFLDQFARHYQTDELIPMELVNKLKKSENFNVGYTCLRQLSFGMLDMAWYTQKTRFSGNVSDFEQNAWKEAMVLPAVKGTCMSTQFSHIFSGGYAAGYYSYKWAEVLDADAFSVFKRNGIFNKEVASSFRKNILSRGNTEDPMALYVRFKGQEPSINALLNRDGIGSQDVNKTITDYEKIMNSYIVLIDEIKKEKNLNKKSKKINQLSSLTKEIQSITQRISALSDDFTPEQQVRINTIAKQLDDSLIDE